jgi:DNA repair exonuclease SbcCD ATPase subunit
MDTSMPADDDVDTSKWKIRKAVFSDLRDLEPATREQHMFVLGLRPISKQERRIAQSKSMGGLSGGFLPNISNHSSGRGGYKHGDKQPDELETLRKENKMLLKEMQQLTSHSNSVEKDLEDALAREEKYKEQLVDCEKDTEDLEMDNKDLVQQKQQLQQELEELQEKFQAAMMREMAKFPTREPSHLVFGKQRKPTKEMTAAHAELDWFEQQHIPKKKKNTNKV